MSFSMSQEQEIIKKYWMKNDGSYIIQSLAGTGKTTIIVECLKATPEPALALAFMKSAVSVIQERLGETHHTVGTLNSVGYGLLREFWKENDVPWKNIKVDMYKYRKIVEMLTTVIDPKTGKEIPTLEYNQIMMIVDAVNHVRANLAPESDWDDVDRVCQNMYIILDQEKFELVQKTIELGKQMILEGVVDFEDQIWGPVIYRMVPKKQFSAIMIDEAQDLTHSKRELAALFLAPGGRVFAAGDRNQAIQGWAGAAARSFELVKQRFGCTELAMTNTWRFGPNIAKLSHSIVPELNGIGTGRDEVMYQATMGIHFPVKDTAIMSRFNWPLIKLAIEYFKMGIPVRLKNDKIAQDMVSKLAGAAKLPGFDWSRLTASLWMYYDTKVKWTEEKGLSKSWLSELKETIELIIMAHQMIKPVDMADFKYRLETIFQGTEGPLLITVHSSKGMQFDTVYLLEPETLEAEATRYRNQDELDAAMCLEYVALTRAAQTIIFVAEAEIGVPEKTE